MPSERLQLEWLGRQSTPAWGGHLERGEPLGAGDDIRRWIDNGWIEAVGTQGYRLTDVGRAALSRLN